MGGTHRRSISTARTPAPLLLLLGGLIVAPALLVPALDAQDSASSQGTSSASGAAATTVLPRGKKLMLTDGSFQLVREYKIEGDRVRYYSIDSSQWEQIPLAMVDWEATKKVEAEEAKTDAALVAKVHKQEAARVAVPQDIDASLEVAPGVFLPPGDLLFVYDGRAVLPLPQAETDSKLSKGHFIEQVMVPIPIVPTRHSISIAGAHAKLRIREGRPEFYIRVSDSRQPALVLIRAKAHGDNATSKTWIRCSENKKRSGTRCRCRPGTLPRASTALRLARNSAQGNMRLLKWLRTRAPGCTSGTSGWMGNSPGPATECGARSPRGYFA
jgi:hypothetical protein